MSHNESSSSQRIPETQNTASQQNISIEELVAQVDGRSHCKPLHPDIIDEEHIWFQEDPEGVISKSILSIFKTQLDHPYTTYASMPPEKKKDFFRTFAYSYTWHPNLTPLVQQTFDKYTSRLFSSHMYAWRQKWLKKKGKPEDLTQTVWDAYQIYWALESTKATSAIQSGNRMSNKDGLGPSTQNLGPISMGTQKRRMAKANDGVPPSLDEMMRLRHTNKKTGEIQNKRVKKILDDVDDEIMNITSQRAEEDGSPASPLSRAEINKIVIARAPKTKGRTLGLGRMDTKKFRW